MFDLKREWTISFAGCGFMGIYYVGATSCILERFPRFIQGASKIYGSSAGALMAAVLTIGIPLELTCADLMFMAKGARKHRLGPLHPAYNLLQLVKDSLQRMLPEDAHIRATGRLCVSLTRVSDGKNVLVSEYDSRDELMEALICSCFVPFYCGIIPPKYRGVHYVDGAVSDNLPRCHERNTITISAFAGESDLCPRTSVLNFHQVRFNNMSVEVTGENMYRVKSTFFPPDAEEMAKISDNGYIDALRFLQDNDLISSECPLRGLALDTVCCELAKELAESEESSETPQQSAVKQPREEHRWLDPKLVENLPVYIKKQLCEACRDAKNSGGLLSRVSDYLPKKMTSYLQMPRILPVGVESARSVAQRLVDWIPDVPGNMSWLYGMAGNIYKQAWKGDDEDYYSEEPLRRCSSLPSDLNLWDKSRGDLAVLPLTPPATPTSDLTFTWNKHSTKSGPSMPLTPPPTPTESPTSGPGEATTESPKSTVGGWGLGRAVGWIRNSILPEQTPPN